MPQQIRIISDGTAQNSRVEVDGKQLDGVKRVSWSIDAARIASAIITVDNVGVDVVGRRIGSWQLPAYRTRRGLRHRLGRIRGGVRFALGRD